MTLSTLIIANPISAGGRTARELHSSLKAMRQMLGSFELEWTKGSRDAERLAREGVRAGIVRIIVAGGDGTANQVISGLLSSGVDRSVDLGFLPFGTGSDLCRSLRLPGRAEDAISCIKEGHINYVDAGRVSLSSYTGLERVAYFVNVLSLGLSAEIPALLGPKSKRFFRRAAFLIGSLRGIIGFRARQVRLCLDDVVIFEGSLCFAAVANGSFFGGGMMVAPGADLGDGAFDLVTVGALPKMRLLLEMPKIFRGRHISLPEVITHRGRSFEAKVLDGGNCPVEVDGEHLGILPVRVDILPSALRVLSPPS